MDTKLTQDELNAFGHVARELSQMGYPKDHADARKHWRETAPAGRASDVLPSATFKCARVPDPLLLVQLSGHDDDAKMGSPFAPRDS